MGRKGKPSRRENPAAQVKKPRGGSVAENANAKQFDWALDLIDIDCLFGWRCTSHEDLLKVIFPKLKNFEKMTWGQMPTTGSHEIEVHKIHADAQKRLAELGHDDLDTVYSLRLMGTPRIFGIKDGAIFRMLWWDPDHTICPSPLKHT